MNFLELKVLISPFTDPFINLSIENQLLSEVEAHQKIIFFYQNTSCVVMGRFQNPWVECKIGKMKNENVELVRRQSGGGTVYHDLGNLNFSFIQATRDHLKDDNNEIIVNALKNFDLKAFASGRSDLLINCDDINYKFSGSAFKQKKDRSFHHGTLLINSDLERLNYYLHAFHKKIEAKGIKSVRSKVINLKGLNNSITKDALIKSISESAKIFYKIDAIETKSVENYIKLNEVESYKKSLLDWKWLFGETPHFELEVITGVGKCFLDINKGVVKACELSEHNVHPSLLNCVENTLIGQDFTLESVERVFYKQVEEFPMYKQELLEILNALKEQVEI